jgi:FAD dependent oxidoreductase
MPPSALPGYPGPRKKYCLCCGISVGASDQPNLNKGWASARWERKQQIIADHKYFELGTFFFLANDASVPEAVRAKFSSYGLCADEFKDFGYIPPQIYIRISNRLVGDYVMTQNNIAAPRSKPDSIAVGDWSLDEHMTGKYAVPVAGQPGKFEVVLEGNFWPNLPNDTNWYDVPFAIMVPKAGTGANLLVPVALSASAVAYSSTRIENMFMSVGAAAGGKYYSTRLRSYSPPSPQTNPCPLSLLSLTPVTVAAKQLVDGDAATVQAVDVAKVQAILTTTFKQRIHGPPGT